MLARKKYNIFIKNFKIDYTYTLLQLQIKNERDAAII